MCQSWSLFCLFSVFSHYISNINWKSMDRIWTQGRMMVGADGSTELWWPPSSFWGYFLNNFAVKEIICMSKWQKIKKCQFAAERSVRQKLWWPVWQISKFWIFCTLSLVFCTLSFSLPFAGEGFESSTGRLCGECFNQCSLHVFFSIFV